MTPQGFDYLRKLLRERSGLVLAAEKQYLAESLRAGAFIRVEFIDRWLGADARRRLEAILFMVALAYTVLLAWEFWRLTLQSFRFGSTSLQVSRTPLWIPQTCMAVGASILALQLVVETLRRLTGEAART